MAVDGRLPGLDLPAAALDEEAFEIVVELSTSRPGFLADILTTFESDSELRLQMIDAAIATEDAEAMWKAAHTLKSSCGIVGAIRMFALSQWLEDSGLSASLGGCAEAARQLRHEFNALCSTLRIRLDSFLQ